MTSEDQGMEIREKNTRRIRRVGNLVDQRVAHLLRGLTEAKSDSAARALLAKLRNAATKEPGDDPEVWSATHDPAAADMTWDDPTWDEMAIHIAMTTFAIHQQSRTEPMHVPGVGFGRAMRVLIGFDEENPSARARFNSLLTADSVNRLRYELRSIAALLRAKNIPFDYAMFADDIAAFQNPDRRSAVRLRWSRQFYQVKSKDAVESDSIHTEEQQ